MRVEWHQFAEELSIVRGLHLDCRRVRILHTTPPHANLLCNGNGPLNQAVAGLYGHRYQQLVHDIVKQQIIQIVDRPQVAVGHIRGHLAHRTIIDKPNQLDCGVITRANLSPCLYCSAAAAKNQHELRVAGCYPGAANHAACFIDKDINKEDAPNLRAGTRGVRGVQERHQQPRHRPASLCDPTQFAKNTLGLLPVEIQSPEAIAPCEHKQASKRRIENGDAHLKELVYSPVRHTLTIPICHRRESHGHCEQCVHSWQDSKRISSTASHCLLLDCFSECRSDSIARALLLAASCALRPEIRMLRKFRISRLPLWPSAAF